ncbi:MAG: Holliday junction branch migration protein RuvA [Mycobacteriales bacterium]|nr:Holliday junction branch migration protein RuvA [Frankia sp.]
MIASVRGRVTALAPEGVVVEVGGVGLQVQCTPGTIATMRIGEEAVLATMLVVREDSLTLFGFADADERAVFELLQTASGVGPRLAQAVLAVHRPDDVRRAVATEDVAALTLVPGVGRKGAQRMVLELKDRLGPPATSGATTAPTSAATTTRDQVRTALLGLGYTGREAEEALSAAGSAVTDDDTGALLRAALQTLVRA